jgi:Bacterial Ig-like domain (group 3)/FG-GAP-like repeat/Domain of unknown function (DUF4214)/FG-GAP repeat
MHTIPPHRLRIRPLVERLEDRCLLRFAPALPLDAGALPSAMATADFNGDGRPDLAVSNDTQSGGVCVLLGNADGTFQPAQAYAAGADTSAVTTGDFNHDGKPDLVVAEADGGTVSVRLGQGNGTFAAAQSFPAGPNPSALITADFNHDGRLDLAVVDDGGVGSVTGQRGVSVLLGQGDGTFVTLPPLPVGLSPVSIAAADFDEDGTPDLAVAQANFDRIRILHGQGDGTFLAGQDYAVAPDPVSITAADLNGDGHADLVVANGFNVDASVLLGQGTGRFGAVKTFAPDPNSGYHAVLVDDFNGDGHPDLALAGCPGFVLVLNGDGTGNFPTYTSLTGGIDGMALAAGDFNGDGQPDLVATSMVTDTLALILTQSVTQTTLDVTPAQAALGQALTLRATVRAAGTVVPTGKVQFFDGNALLATATLDATGAVTQAALLAGGSHTLRASYCGDRNFDASDSPVVPATVGDPVPVDDPASAPTTPPVVSPPAAPAPTFNQRFVAQMYQDLLGRTADPGGLAHWSVLLDLGTSPADIVRGITASLEYRTNQVQDLYHRLLHRDADSSGLAFFTAFLAIGTVEQAAAMVAGSPEYFQAHGGSTDEFLNALFLDALDRDIDVQGQATFRQALAQGATRQQVADAVFASAEYRELLVRGFYQRFLQRDADLGGLQNHVNRLAQGQTDEQLIAAFLASPEHLSKV